MSDDDGRDSPNEGNVITVDFGGFKPVQLQPEGAETQIVDKFRGPKGLCRHVRLQLIELERRAQCLECEARLDPFDILLAYARRERDWRFYDREQRQAQKRLGELQDEEKRVKARTKNAARKDADEAVRAERARWAEKRSQLRFRAKQLEVLAEFITRMCEEKDP